MLAAETPGGTMNYWLKWLLINIAALAAATVIA